MNIQNIPRSQKDVKRAFLPMLDAYLFMDYKAIEVRLLAYYLLIGISDTSLRDEISAGMDPHAQTAKGLFGREDITDEERQVGKTLNFSIIYGGGAPTIMRQLGVDYKEAKKLLEAYHATRPGINRLRDRISRILDHRGYLVSSHGRRLHVKDAHKALNALIQGSAADVMREAVVRTHKYLANRESYIVNIIHDEIMLDANNSEIPILVEAVPTLMLPDKIHKIMPIEVDVEISRTNWADKESYHDHSIEPAIDEREAISV
jgi:DNA polymerase-1